MDGSFKDLFESCMQIIPTILCGGAGSRLWPVSRALHPKPFIKLDDGQSLIQKAFLRASCLSGVTDILTVTNRELLFKIQDEYQAMNQQGMHTPMLLEPFGRNTAAAIALSALHINKHYGPEAQMLVLAADHLIQDEDAFQKAVTNALALAAQEKLVTFGIKPERAETGFGYIEVDTSLPINASEASELPLGYGISRFVEKPILEHAKTFVELGNYLWNSGMFCFTASTVLQEMRRFCPEIIEKSIATLEFSKVLDSKSGVQIYLDSATFSELTDISFDYALMEPLSLEDKRETSKLAVVPCAIGWSDVGSWETLGAMTQADVSGNRVVGQAVMKDSSNCYIHSSDRVVATVGLDNLIIVDTPDALLVADRAQAQDVKSIYESLKTQDHDVHRLHRTVHRPWGTYTVLEEGECFKIKRIEVKPRGRLSLQMHHHRSEHWIVVQGIAKVTNGDQELLIQTNESTYISAGKKHRLENPGLLPLVLIEVQSGQYLGEDDIVRFEDNYGRVEV